MTARKYVWVAPLVLSLGPSCAVYAQQARAPTLEEILHRLDVNLRHYDAGVPSLFCDEHAVSQRSPGEADQNTVTDSIFRLKRSVQPDHTTTLEESREVKFVDGKPASSADIDGPTLLSGAFEGGFAVVSLSQQSCMSYELQKINGKRPNEPYVVRFATELTPQNAGECLLQEESKGRALIDPASMQITRLEITTPHHVIIPGDRHDEPVVGKRVLSVDYAPVVLGTETFWLPSTSTMRAISGEGSFHAIVWSFEAKYRDYHRLEVTSRIHSEK